MLPRFSPILGCIRAEQNASHFRPKLETTDPRLANLFALQYVSYKGRQLMITICIRYTIDPRKHDDFERYARNWPEPIQRCGGQLLGYFLPTRMAGATNLAYALINFPSLADYEKYREALMDDAGAKENFAFADGSACILIEDRSVLQQIS